MEQTHGYLYLRTHQYYDIEDVYLIGTTNDIEESDKEFTSNEWKRGYFTLIFQIPINKMKLIERLIGMQFHDLNVYKGGGTGFYKKKIITLIEPFLDEIKIKYKNLSNKRLKK